MFEHMHKSDDGQAEAVEPSQNTSVMSEAASIDQLIDGIYQDLQSTAMQKQDIETLLNRSSRRILPLVFLYMLCPNGACSRWWNDNAQNGDYLKMLGYSTIATAAAAYVALDITTLSQLDQQERQLRAGVQEIERLISGMSAQGSQEYDQLDAAENSDDMPETYKGADPLLS